MHDITEIISERLIGQYKDSPVILAFLNSLSTEYDFLYGEIKRVVDERYFDNAQNINLDIIGSIVGVGREVTDFVETDYFSFLQDPTGKGFDSLTEKVKAGRYRSADENAVTTRKLNDSEYRILINAKILKNISNITPNDVLLITRQILELMYPNININVNIEETGNASFRVIINYILTPAEKSFISSLDLIPRPVGVRIEYVHEDIDIDLGVSLSTTFSDTIVNIMTSAPSQALIQTIFEDSITSIASEVSTGVGIGITLEDSSVFIQVAPPGTVSIMTLLEDTVSSINSATEQNLSLSILLGETVVSMLSNIVNDAELLVVSNDSLVSIQAEVVAEILLSRATPINFVASCSLICTGGDYSVDWGNGIYVNYTAGATATSVPTGEIKVRETGTVSNIKFTTDTYSSITIEEGSNLTNMNSICINLTQLVSFNVVSPLPLMTGQMFDSFNGCTSLLVAPAMDYSAISGFSRTFQTCTSMTSAANISVQPPIALTIMRSTFAFCTSLSEVTLFSTNSVGSWQSAFESCQSLIKIPAFNMSSSTSFSGTYNNCNVLECIANIDTTGSVGANSMFVNTPALTAPNATQQLALEAAGGSTFSTTCP